MQNARRIFNNAVCSNKIQWDFTSATRHDIPWYRDWVFVCLEATAQFLTPLIKLGTFERFKIINTFRLPDLKQLNKINVIISVIVCTYS